MADPAFVKLEAFGPEGSGLTRRPPYPKEGLETEPPVHSSHLYVNDEAHGIKIGVWECTPHTSKMNPFPVNEFMILLEGSVTMLEKDGKSTTVGAGEAFMVPQGVVCQWKQSEPVRKFFAIQGGGPDQAPRTTEQPLSVLKTATGPRTAQAGKSAKPGTSLPFASGTLIYTDPRSGYSLAIWERPTAESRPVVLRSYETIRIEAGSLTLSDADGTTQSFKAGDTVLITPGRPVNWKGSEELRILACGIQDDQAAALQGAAE